MSTQPSTFVTLTEEQISAYALCSVPPPENVEYGEIPMQGTLTPTPEEPLIGGSESITDAPHPANMVSADTMNEEVD